MSRRRLLAWGLLLLLSVGLHLFRLGDRSFHHDESIHAKLSWDLATRGIYRYDPTYHGPLLYYLTAASLKGLGDSDFTARLPIALAGIGLVGLAWGLRRRLGERAAWWAGLLATISPLTLFYGRFLRMDLLELVTASAAVLAFWRTRRGSSLAWIGVGGFAGLAFATKENAYVTAALLGATAVVLAVDMGLRRSVDAVRAWLARSWTGLVMAAAAFVIVTVPLYTAGFAHAGDWLFPIKAISYWWGQHTIQRVQGPWWFHLPRLAMYEFLAIAAATAWVVRRWRRLRPVELGLYAFGVLSILMYVYLGEKVPWLGVHQVWAFLPLAGAQLARTFGPAGRWWSRGLAAAGLAATLVASLVASFVLDEISPAQRRVEALHFVQTCPELTAVAREVRASAATTEGALAAIHGEAAWPLNWYWRDLPVLWNLPRPGERPPIVVCDPEDEISLRRRLGPDYSRERIPLRAWWLMYQSRPSLGQALRYAVTRVPWGGIGSTDVVVLRRGGTEPEPAAAVEVPGALADALGARRARVLGEGWLGEVRGLDDGPDGVVLADSSLSRVTVLDEDGGLRQLMEGDGLNQPEDVAWTAGGGVVVADTWSHRVLRLAPDGGATTLPPPPDGWYGPRSVAVSPAGRVVVADTGQKRLVLYGPELGEPVVLASGDGWGGLVEPGGVAWLDDDTVLVCDTGNRRLLAIGRDGALRREVPLPDAWSDFYSRPQVAVLPGGRWLASDTPASALWLVGPDGSPRRLDLAPAGLAPTGVAFDAATGRLHLGDLSGRVWEIEVGDGDS